MLYHVSVVLAGSYLPSAGEQVCKLALVFEVEGRAALVVSPVFLGVYLSAVVYGRPDLVGHLDEGILTIAPGSVCRFHVAELGRQVEAADL